jgi:hypothetical protein
MAWHGIILGHRYPGRWIGNVHEDFVIGLHPVLRVPVEGQVQPLVVLLNIILEQTQHIAKQGVHITRFRLSGQVAEVRLDDDRADSQWLSQRTPQVRIGEAQPHRIVPRWEGRG